MPRDAGLATVPTCGTGAGSGHRHDHRLDNTHERLHKNYTGYAASSYADEFIGEGRKKGVQVSGNLAGITFVYSLVYTWHTACTEIMRIHR